MMLTTSSLSSQAPVSSATKASMGRATPARPWTASTTPSALSAAPVVSAAPRPQALPTHVHTYIRSQVPRESRACASSFARGGSPPCIWTTTAAPPCLLLHASVLYLALPPPCWVCFLESALPLFSLFPPLCSSPFLLPPFLPSLDSCPALWPLLGGVWSWAVELPGATVKDWNVGRAGVGWGSGELWRAERGFSLGWSEFSHLARVQATGPCQADDITLQECPLLLAQEARLEGGCSQRP